MVAATQFMEFIGGIADFSTKEGTVRVGNGLFQPIAVDDVVANLAQVALAAPLNGTAEIAGPDRLPFAEIIARYLKSTGDARPVLMDPDAVYYGGRVEEQSLVRRLFEQDVATVVSQNREIEPLPPSLIDHT